MEAQAEKRVADMRKQLAIAKNLILRYRGFLAERNLEAPEALDRDAFGWLQTSLSLSNQTGHEP
jgi:hypothetical protein